MGAMTRLQIESLAERNEEPGWFESICADIANGATVDAAYAKLTNEYAVSWGALRTWIRADEKREAQYQAALADRLEYRRERAAANVTQIATVAHENAEVSVTDTLKAADMVLGATKGGGISVGVGSGAGRVKIEVEFVGAGGG